MIRPKAGPQEQAWPTLSEIEFFRVFRAFHDEAEPRRRILAHQLVDHAIGDELIGDLGAVVLRRDKFPQWKGSAFVGATRNNTGQHIQRVVFDDKGLPT